MTILLALAIPSTSPTPWTASTPSTYRVTDSNDPEAQVATDSIEITVSADNVAPTADVSLFHLRTSDPAVEIEPGDGITLDGSSSFDPDAAYGDSIVTYTWMIGGHAIESNGMVVDLPWNDPGNGLYLSKWDDLPTNGDPITVQLVVTDEWDHQSDPLPPRPSRSMTAGPLQSSNRTRNPQSSTATKPSRSTPDASYHTWNG